ncbi:hypothetical protein BBP40_007661 [Aspergillus hancockii]|nr:hypothetical protein BBP40_007661 [Aspergillus hancockii]
MSDYRPDITREDRYRSDVLTTLGSEENTAESWPWIEYKTMATNSGTGSTPAPDASENNENVSIVQKMVSATCGSILTGLLGAIGAPSPAVADCAVEEVQRRTFTSTLDGLRKIARNEGMLALWRGLSPTLMMGIPANIIYFAGYDWLRSDERSPVKKHLPDSYVAFVAGSVARVAAASAISPIEMFRTRLQATPGTGAGHFKATLEGLHHMTKTQGYSSLWRGLTLTMWRDVPFSGLYWWGYEEVKKRLIEARQEAHDHLLPTVASSTGHHHSEDLHTPTFFDSFLAGATSGSVAAFVTTPFDVGKTRQQVYQHSGDNLSNYQKGNLPRGPLQPEQLSLPRFLMHIFREEGMAGLFRGWVARCLKVAPACAIMISTYELGKKTARGVNERRHSADEHPVSR